MKKNDFQGCADIWSPKALRSGAGGHFKIPILKSMSWSEIPHLVPKHAQVLLADHSTISNQQKQINYTEKLRGLLQKCQPYVSEKEDLSYEEPEILQEYANLPMETLAWNQVDINSEVVLVLGGETHGLSLMAKKLAHERNGTIVSIPLKNEIDSLNVASAASILLYQIQTRLENLS